MEKEGLLRAVHNLHQRKLKISLLVTDRHRQIAKWVRENLSEADYRYDIWHLAKGTVYLCTGIFLSNKLSYLCIYYFLKSFSLKSGNFSQGEGL